MRNIAAFPLAIPLMAGPGAISASVLLAGRAGDQPLRVVMLLGVIALVLALCGVVFLLAARIAKMLGTTGNVVLSRLLGVLLGRAGGAIRDRRRARGAGRLSAAV